ncbi:Adaptor for signal transduction [Chytriomyces hyalinus]|nr:Adaptor for signal transduction [Chytriomyces hyalinus]
METWNVTDVVSFIKLVGLGSYESAFKENDITGDLLAHADHAMLRQLGMNTVGHRIALLSAVTAAQAGSSSSGKDQLASHLGSRNNENDDVVMDRMATEIAKLHNELASLRADLAPIWFLVEEYKSRSKESKVATPNTALYPPDLLKRSEVAPPPSPSEATVGTIRICLDAIFNNENDTTNKNFRVTEADIGSKILAGILKKYNIRENWRDYCLYIRFAGQERRLNNDEKPLALQNKIKDDSNTIPSFTIKKLPPEPSSAGTTVVNPSSQQSPTVLKRGGGRGGNTSSVQSEGRVLTAVYNYKAARDDELNVMIGDRFKVVKKDREWFTVKSLETPGLVGWVPCGCLKEIEEDRRTYATASTKPGLPADVELPAQVSVLYDFDGTGTSNALPVKAGDILAIQKKEDNWLLAKLGDRKGWVPDAYVALMISDSPVEAKTPKARIAGLLDRFDDKLIDEQSTSETKMVQLSTGKSVNFVALMEIVNVGIGRWIEMEHRQESVLVGDKTLILEHLSTGLKWVSQISARMESIRSNPKRDEIVMYLATASEAIKLCGAQDVVDEDVQLELVFSALGSAVKLL